MLKITNKCQTIIHYSLGMHPQQQAASCAYMIFWTGISAVIQYRYYDLIGWNFILIFGAVGIVDAQYAANFKLNGGRIGLK